MREPFRENGYAPGLHAQTSEDRVTFPDFASLHARVTDLRDAGDFEAVLELASHEQAHFPDDRNAIIYWRICAAARTDQAGLAIWILEEALSTGTWYAVDWLIGAEDLAPLQSNEDFARLVQVCRERQQRTTQRCAPAITLIRPDETPPWPLLLCLHGNGQNAAQAMPWWRSAAHAGWLVAVAQSGTPVGPLGYAWGAATTGEITSHLTALRRSADVDAGRIVLGGFSRGAYHALRLAVSLPQPDGIRGAICVAPSLRTIEELEPSLPTAAERGLRVAFVAGEQDSMAIAAVPTIAAQLQKAGLDVRTHFQPNVAHTYPEHFPALLPELLKFVTGSD